MGVKVSQNPAVVPEARLEQTEAGLQPVGDGWFVLNARDAVWADHELLGSMTRFEDATDFEQLGISIRVLRPGQPMAYYHGESGQEDFLVLRGECVLLIEGEERPLKAWDFVHCPPWTEHVLVGAGTEPAVVLAVGARVGEGVRYPRSELALRHRAGAGQETTVPDEAYARVGRLRNAPRRRYREGELGP
jgi:uncharacterized cupin superfamily protein